MNGAPSYFGVAAGNPSVHIMINNVMVHQEGMKLIFELLRKTILYRNEAFFIVN